MEEHSVSVDITTIGSEFLSPDAELDLSGAGLQRTRANFSIVTATLGKTKKGDGQLVTVEFESTTPVDDQDNFSVSDYLLVQHSNPKAAKGGQSRLKQLFKAVFGENATGSVTNLIGKIVSAEVWEDTEGFRRIGKYQTTDSEAAEVAAVMPSAGISL